MAKGSFYTKFRGEEYSIAYDLDFSGPGSGVGGEWWFEDLTAEQHDALKITPEEDEALFRECVNYADGLLREPMEGDIPLFGAGDRDPTQPLGTPLSELAGRPDGTREGDKRYAEFVRIAKSWGYD